MKISIEYPQVMKMQQTTTFEVSISVTLKEVKERIFEDFWNSYMKAFKPTVDKHGTIEEVHLKDKDIEITTDESLRERLLGTPIFQTVFKQH